MDNVMVAPRATTADVAQPAVWRLTGDGASLSAAWQEDDTDVARLHGRIASLEGEVARRHLLAAQAERLVRVGSWDLDLDAARLSWSEGTYRIFGLDPAVPVTLRQAVSLYTAEARRAVDALLPRAVATGEPFDVTLPHMTADGARRWVRAMGQVITDENGHHRLIAMLRDVTDERRAGGRQ